MNRLVIDQVFPQRTGPFLLIGGVTVFAPLIEGGTTQAPVLIVRLVLLSTLGYWLLSGLRCSTLSLPRTPLWWPLAAFCCLTGLSLLWSGYTTVTLQWIVTILFYIVFFGVVFRVGDSMQRVRSCVILVLAMGCLEGGLGVVQYLWLGEARAKGTFFNPNFFATYEAVSSVLAFSVLAGGIPIRKTERLLLALAAAISCTGVLLAQSRGGTAAFLLALLFVGVARYGKAALIVVLILAVGVITIPNPLKERAMAVSKHDPYAYSRIEIWKNSFDRVLDHPMGIGLGMYKYASFQYRFPIEGAIVRYGKRAESAHNEYLQLAVECGIVGLALFLVGVGVWSYEVRTLFKERLSQGDRGIAVGLCAGVLAILAHAGVDSVFHEPALVLLLIMLGGLVCAMRKIFFPAEAEWHLHIPYQPANVALVAVLVAALTVLIIRPAAAWFMVEQGNKTLTDTENRAAIEWYQYASCIDPGSTFVRDGLARFYLQRFMQSGHPEWLQQAAAELEVAMSFNGLDGRMPYRLGTIYLLLAEQQQSAASRDAFIAQAAQAFENAITLDPFSPFGYFELGKLRRGQGDPLAARQLFERAIVYEPNFIPARIALTDLAKESGHAEIAELHVSAIRNIRFKYQGWNLTPLERQFLAMPTADS